MKQRIITISREFGSGGRTIAKEVAERLRIPCYDQELIEKVAEESGFAKEYIAEHGEQTGNWLTNAFAAAASYYGPIGRDFVWMAQRKVILELAESIPASSSGGARTSSCATGQTFSKCSSMPIPPSVPTASCVSTASGKIRPKSASAIRISAAWHTTATIPTSTGASPKITTSASTAARSASTAAPTSSSRSSEPQQKTFRLGREGSGGRANFPARPSFAAFSPYFHENPAQFSCFFCAGKIYY